MAYTLSNMLELGSAAPDFELFDTLSGTTQSLQDLKSDKATVVMFICNHCPYVIHLFRPLVDLATEYKEKGISFIAISSNDVENYPDDSPDKMNIVGRVLQFSFPYLYDENQSVAKAYDAACTPDFYVFDQDLLLRYRGQFDASRPGNEKSVSGEDLRAALDAMLSHSPVPEKQIPSGGCNIKWKT